MCLFMRNMECYACDHFLEMWLINLQMAYIHLSELIWVFWVVCLFQRNANYMSVMGFDHVNKQHFFASTMLWFQDGGSCVFKHLQQGTCSCRTSLNHIPQLKSKHCGASGTNLRSLTCSLFVLTARINETSSGGIYGFYLTKKDESFQIPLVWTDDVIDHLTHVSAVSHLHAHTYTDD